MARNHPADYCLLPNMTPEKQIHVIMTQPKIKQVLFNTGCHEAVSSLHMQCKVLPFQGHLLILVLLENICSEINCVVLNSEIKTKAVVS